MKAEYKNYSYYKQMHSLVETLIIKREQLLILENIIRLVLLKGTIALGWIVGELLSVVTDNTFVSLVVLIFSVIELFYLMKNYSFVKRDIQDYEEKINRIESK